MPIQLNPTAGTTVRVSTATPATFTEAGYAALSWVEVNGFSNAGEIGDTQEVQNFDSLKDGRIKYRGIADPGQIDAAMADLPADPGQVILKAAFAAGRGSAGELISIHIEGPDGTGTYAQTMVAGWRRVYGGANDIQMRNATLPIIAGTVVEHT